MDEKKRMQRMLDRGCERVDGKPEPEGLTRETRSIHTPGCPFCDCPPMGTVEVTADSIAAGCAMHRLALAGAEFPDRSRDQAAPRVQMRGALPTVRVKQGRHTDLTDLEAFVAQASRDPGAILAIRPTAVVSDQWRKTCRCATTLAEHAEGVGPAASYRCANCHAPLERLPSEPAPPADDWYITGRGADHG
jgi:hypothetical protein